MTMFKAARKTTKYLIASLDEGSAAGWANFLDSRPALADLGGVRLPGLVGRGAVHYTHLTLPTIYAVSITVVAESLKQKSTPYALKMTNVNRPSINTSE